MIIVLQCSCVLLWVSNIYTLLVGEDISALISAQRLDLFKIVMDKNWFSLSGIGSSEKRNMHAGSFETCGRKMINCMHLW